MNTLSPNATEAKGFYKLSWLQRIGFGSGDLAQNLIYQTVAQYLLIFYTNVYGLPAATAAIMFLIVREFRWTCGGVWNSYYRKNTISRW